jgi:hypothetical protein
LRPFTLRSLLFSSLALLSAARADTPAQANAPPKPAPMLVEAFKGMTGTWACNGKFKKTDGSGDMDSQSTMVITSELDGFTYSGAYQVPKSDVFPTGMQGQIFWSYDSAQNRLVEFFADSYGATGHGTSDGLRGDMVVWQEDEVLMGQRRKVRTTVQRVSPTEIALTFDADANGTWVNMGTNSCKRK